MTPQIKNRILIAGIILAVGAVAALMLILQPSSVKAEAASPTSTAAATASASASAGASAKPLNLSAGNAGQTATDTGALPPGSARSTDLPKAPPATEPYKQAAEKAGGEFLKIYFNAPGSSMEKPDSYIDQLAPYATKDVLDKLRAPIPANADWTMLGKRLHDKKLNYVVTPSCSLAPGQAFAPKFDEADGGNLPCTFTMIIAGQDGTEYSGKDLPVATNSSGTQSLKMVNENGAWKVAAIDSYGQ